MMLYLDIWLVTKFLAFEYTIFLVLTFDSPFCIFPKPNRLLRFMELNNLLLTLLHHFLVLTYDLWISLAFFFWQVDYLFIFSTTEPLS